MDIARPTRRSIIATLGGVIRVLRRRGLLAGGLLACNCVPGAAGAGEFSWDLSGGASQSATGDTLDTDGSTLAATYYFDSVDDSQGPYSLATFFDPASRVSLAIARTKATTHLTGFVPPGVAPDLTTTTDEYTIGGQYWLSASKWYAGGTYTTRNADLPVVTGLFVTRADSNAYRVFAGKYLGPKTSLELGLSRSVGKLGQIVDLCPPPAVCAIGGRIDIESKTVNDDIDLRFVHVRRFRSLTYSLFGGVTESSGHSTIEANPTPPVLFTGSGNIREHWTYSFGAEAFPTTRLGVRVGYTRADNHSVRNDSYDVAATWFFKRNIGIQVSWSQTQAHSDFATFPNDDTTSIRFIGRL